MSSVLRYTILAETRPDGRVAVERVIVSGWGTWPLVWASRNQAWKRVDGEASSDERDSVPWRNWAAAALVSEPAGATVW